MPLGWCLNLNLIMQHTDTLTTAAHDQCLMQGEIINAAAMADLVQDIEAYTGHEFTAAEIRACYNAAGELFVDSMQENAADSLPEAEAVEEVARLEALRPSKIRRQFILSILA